MICDAKLHSTRVHGPALAVKLMRVDNECRNEHKVVSLCQVCYEVNLGRIQNNYYMCQFCRERHWFRWIWRMIGDA